MSRTLVVYRGEPDQLPTGATIVALVREWPMDVDELELAIQRFLEAEFALIDAAIKLWGEDAVRRMAGGWNLHGDRGV